ncbi:MAG: hypothetical protein Q8T09_08650 [Candidatus Melainabacteria bacterium]|nr:hypothetical protein [Candidatus Melainabacteria bacterium]
MSDQLRPSFQAENFRGNDCSPMREAACQAYTPENQAIFRIDIRASRGAESLPGLQIVFEQDGNDSRSSSGRDSGRSSHDRSTDNNRDFSPTDRSSRADQSSHNPWHHGHERHSHSQHRMNDSSSSSDRRFLGNDSSRDFGQSSRFDRSSGNDNCFVSTESPPWETQRDFGSDSRNSFRGGSRDSSRYASPLELLNQLVDYFRQHELSNSFDGRGFSSTGSGTQLRLVDSTYRPPSQSQNSGGLLDSLPNPPSPRDLLSGLPTPPGLPSPGDLLSGLPTPPGLPSPRNIFDRLPNPFKLFG